MVSAAGNLEHAQIEALVSKRLADGSRDGAVRSPAPAPGRRGQRCAFYSKETEQYHVCLGGEGIARNDERRFALSILDAILGSSTSSRLFQEVREKHRLFLCEILFLGQSVGYQETARVGIAAFGAREDNIVEAPGC